MVLSLSSLYLSPDTTLSFLSPLISHVTLSLSLTATLLLHSHHGKDVFPPTFGPNCLRRRRRGRSGRTDGRRFLFSPPPTADRPTLPCGTTCCLSLSLRDPTQVTTETVRRELELELLASPSLLPFLRVWRSGRGYSHTLARRSLAFQALSPSLRCAQVNPHHAHARTMAAATRRTETATVGMCKAAARWRLRSRQEGLPTRFCSKMNIRPVFWTSSPSLPLAPDMRYAANSGWQYFLPGFVLVCPLLSILLSLEFTYVTVMHTPFLSVFNLLSLGAS